MKRFSIISLALFLIMFVYSCNEQVEIAEPNSEFEFVDVVIPDIYKPNLKSTYEEEILEDFITVLNKDGKEVTGKLRITLPITDGCEIIRLELTKNIIQETDITTNFLVDYVDSSSLKSTHNVAECFRSCNNGAEDGSIKRPGWCKFWCVVEAL